MHPCAFDLSSLSIGRVQACPGVKGVKGVVTDYSLSPNTAWVPLPAGQVRELSVTLDYKRFYQSTPVSLEEMQLLNYLVTFNVYFSKCLISVSLFPIASKPSPSAVKASGNS